VDDHLLQAVLARLTALREHGDASQILSQEAADDVARLWHAAVQEPGHIPIPVVQLLGWFHVYRYNLVPEDNFDDLNTAVELFTSLAAVDPGLVPTSLRPLLADGGKSARVDLWEEEAVQLLRRLNSAHDSQALDQALRLLRAALAEADPDHPKPSLLVNLGGALRHQFDYTGDMACCDEAIVVLGRAVEMLPPPGNAERASALTNLAGILLTRFSATGDRQDLDRAIETGWDAVDSTAHEDPARAGRLSNLVSALRLRYERSRNVADLDAAMRAGRECLKIVPDTDPARGVVVANVGMTAMERYRQVGGQAHLDEAIRLFAEALGLLDSSHPYHELILGSALEPLLRWIAQEEGAENVDCAAALLRHVTPLIVDQRDVYAQCQHTVAERLIDRYSIGENPGDLDLAISHSREALTSTPKQDDPYLIRLSDLFKALRLRYDRARSLGDLQEMITLVRDALAQMQLDDEDRAALLLNLQGGLYLRAEHTGQVADLDEAVASASKAVAVIRSGQQFHATALGYHADALDLRFRKTDNITDLNKSIALSRAAAEADKDEAAVYRHLMGAARKISTRINKFNEVDDITDLIDITKRLAAAEPPDPADQAMSFFLVAMSLTQKADRLGGAADLNEALAVLTLVFEQTSANDNPWMLGGYSTVLKMRFDRLGDPRDIDEAIRLSREAVRYAHDNTTKAMSRYVLGIQLNARFERTGRIDDLDEAIHELRLGLAVAEDSLEAVLSELGQVLRKRFDRFNDEADISEAVDLLRRAVSATSTESPDWPGRLTILGGALMSLHQSGHEPSVLREAVSVYREAVDATPLDHPDRTGRLSSLSAALRLLYGQEKDMDTLLEALILARLVASSARDVRDGPSPLNLVGILLDRYQALRELGDLNEAIDICRQLEQELPADHSRRCNVLFTLALCLVERFDAHHDKLDAQEAIKCWREVAGTHTANAVMRLDAARAWGATSAQVWGDAADGVEGYRMAVELIPVVAWRGLPHSGQQRSLQRRGELTREAASCAVAAGNAELASELLEQGRAVLWSRLLETRTDYTELQERAPKLAARMSATRAELDRLTAL
jgi:tetratricopeptide (TPR) repeat protein